MKKLLLIVLAALIFVGCGTDPATLPQKEPGLLRDIDSEKVYQFENGDISYKIPYESGTFQIKQIAFSEEKKDAYYTAYAGIVFDMSGLSEDERQWFYDEYKDIARNLNTKLTVHFDDEYGSMTLLSADLKDLDSTPCFVLLYSREEIKTSINGTSYTVSVEHKKKGESKWYKYNFSGTIVI